MVVGVLQFELSIPYATSIKDKRRVVRSVKDRLHREHMVSVAEVGALDALRTARLGVACAGSSARAVGRTLDLVVAKVDGLREARVTGVRREVFCAEGGVEVEEGEDADGALAAEMLRRGLEAG